MAKHNNMGRIWAEGLDIDKHMRQEVDSVNHEPKELTAVKGKPMVLEGQAQNVGAGGTGFLKIL